MRVLTSRRLSGCTQTAVRRVSDYSAWACWLPGGHTLMSGVPLAVMRLALALEIWRRLVSALKLLSDGVVHDGQLVEERRVALLRVEWPLRQAQLHHGPDAVPVAPLAVMLLNNLEEARVVDAAVLFQLLDLVGDVIELLFQLSQARRRDVALGRWCRSALAALAFALGGCGSGRELLKLVKGGVDSLLQVVDTLLLELGNLFELD